MGKQLKSWKGWLPLNHCRNIAFPLWKSENFLKVCRNMAPQWMVSNYPIFPICGATDLDNRWWGIGMQGQLPQAAARMARQIVKKTAIGNANQKSTSLYNSSSECQRIKKEEQKVTPNCNDTKKWLKARFQNFWCSLQSNKNLILLLKQLISRFY